MSALIEQLANQIESEMGELTDAGEISGVTNGDEFNINVGIDVGAISKKLTGLLQEASNQNNLSHQDSIALATICFHRFMDIPIEEARELAVESISP